MRIKVCGITNLEDALLAYDLGAHALGFIFAPSSPRFISKEICQEIVVALPPFCERVGVFVNETPANIAQVVCECGLSAVQLHGDEDQSLIDELAKLVSVQIIKAVRERDALACNFNFKFTSKNLQALLIDGPRSEEDKRVSLDSFLKFKDEYELPLILAGALNEKNIKEVIKDYSPEAIDLCSALEESPGKKDPEKMRRFMRIFSEFSSDSDSVPEHLA